MTDLAYVTSSSLPSAEELVKISQIRSDCAPQIAALRCKAEDVVGDLRICRFMRAREGNLAEATVWFREFLEWRVKSGVDHDRDQVIGRTPEELIAWYEKRASPYLPICPYAGRNEDGLVIWYIRPGLSDPRKFVERRQASLEAELRVMLLLLEWTLWHLDTLSRAEGRMVMVIKVADFQGLGEGGRSLPIFVPAFRGYHTGLTHTLQRFYCEHDALFALVNTPFVFRAVLSVMRVIMTKRQQSKLRVVGSTDSADVRATLLKMLSAKTMPTEYGGSRVSIPCVFPAPTEADMQRWYETAHLLPVEFPAAAAAEGGQLADAETPKAAAGTTAPPDPESPDATPRPPYAPLEETVPVDLEGLPPPALAAADVMVIEGSGARTTCCC